MAFFNFLYSFMVDLIWFLDRFNLIDYEWALPQQIKWGGEELKS